MVYLAFYNLDLPVTVTAKTYKLLIKTVDFVADICFVCPWYASVSTTCQCSPCPANHYGHTCNYDQPLLKEEESEYTTFYNAANSYFRIIDPPETVNILYRETRETNNVRLYVQFEKREGDLAGELNHLYRQGLSTSKLVTSIENVFSLASQGHNLMVTLSSSSNTQSTTVVLSYENGGKKSRLGMILGALVPVLVVVIIVVACCCRKARRRQLIPENSFYLSKKEINWYYPEVEGSLVLSFLQQLEET